VSLGLGRIFLFVFFTGNSLTTWSWWSEVFHQQSNLQQFNKRSEFRNGWAQKWLWQYAHLVISIAYTLCFVADTQTSTHFSPGGTNAEVMHQGTF